MWTYTISVKPQGMRFRVAETADQLVITVVRRRNPLLLLWPLWGVFILAMGSAFWWAPLVERRPTKDLWFIVLWTGFIVFWIVTAAAGSFTAVFGEPRLVMTPSELTFSRKVFGIGRTRRWPLRWVEGLHFAHGYQRARRSRVAGGLTFTSRGETVLLGDDLNEAEVNQLVRRMREWAAVHAPAVGML